MSNFKYIDLSGKVALVTGAARGIGREVALALGRAGATLVLNGRSKDSLCETKAALEADNVAFSTAIFDVTDSFAVKEAFQSIYKQYKRLDILVNNAGVLNDALIGMVSERQIKSTYEVNVFGPLYCTQYASRLMVRSGAGSIINLASIIGTNGNEGQSVYGGSKSAVIGMTKSLAKELASKNVRVNAVAPGFIDTDMARSIPEDVFQQRIESVKMGRIGKPEEIAKVVLFLACDLSSYVTGQTIGVDGGMLI
ncbi:SDR family NAD(P)-dependent oxidoreductase [Aliikangiella sp. IMCC44653]